MSKTEALRILAENRARELADDAPAIRKELQKILESAAFRSSHRSKIFLEHVVERTLAGRLDELKERVVGAALFGRAVDYDTGADSTVRVVANETRRRLQAYYAQRGTDPDIRIELPAGSYVPMVHYRRERVEDVEPTILASPLLHRSSNRIWIWSAATLLLAASSVMLALQNRSLRTQLATRSQNAVPLIEPWSALFTGGHGVQILLADTSIGAIQNLRQTQLPLADYINRRYIPGDKPVTPELESFFRFLLGSQYTSASYASTAVRVAQLAQTYSVPVSVSFARDMSLRTFKGGDSFVVLGTTRANPWVQLFDVQLNFSVEFGKDGAQPALRNRAPKFGEASIYRPGPGPMASIRENYGHIAFLPSLYQGGHILVVSGTSSEATEAAGDFVTNRDRLKEALVRLGADPYGEPRYFEVLLQVRSTSGAPLQSQVISGRLKNAR
jgi:hypothetical protein